MILHNAHIIAYYQFQCRFAEYLKRPLAQWYWYTQAMQEQDPQWNSEKILSASPVKRTLTTK